MILPKKYNLKVTRIAQLHNFYEHKSVLLYFHSTRKSKMAFIRKFYIRSCLECARSRRRLAIPAAGKSALSDGKLKNKFHRYQDIAEAVRSTLRYYLSPVNQFSSVDRTAEKSAVKIFGNRISLDASRSKPRAVARNPVRLIVTAPFMSLKCN